MVVLCLLVVAVMCVCVCVCVGVRAGVCVVLCVCVLFHSIGVCLYFCCFPLADYPVMFGMFVFVSF